MNAQRGNIAYSQIRGSNRFGNGTAIQMAGGTSAVVGNCSVYDASGNLVDSGVPPGSGGGFSISVNGLPVYNVINLEVNGSVV